MRYSLEFDQRALKEWHKLDATIQAQLKKKLAQVLENPKVEANRLREFDNWLQNQTATKRLSTGLSGAR